MPLPPPPSVQYLLPICIMEYTYKIATLNINGISAVTRIRMLEDFLYKHDLDLILLQEVTDNTISKIQRYTPYINIGSEGRGTAILAKDCYTLTNINRIPTGRGISAQFNDIKIVNIYALSGSEKKRERDDFYNNDVALLLVHPNPHMILAGDFNCVFSNSDCTDSPLISRALPNLAKRLELIDLWDATRGRQIFTHYTAQGATRIDRIYLSKRFLQQKRAPKQLPWHSQITMQ
jgi:exonuclease III